MTKSSETVYVGMSGGVDSSTTAALLKDQGYNVVGVYMKNWALDLPGFDCPWREDLADAKRVAVQLDIPFKIFDLQEEYKQKVVDYLVDGYRQGITPNPDVMCNQEIKFKVFLQACIDDGACLIATGHYAKTKNGELFKGKDDSKDQTYFLYRVQSSALEKTLFPLGDLLKGEVRAIAAEKNLVTADKKESMGICFVGKVDIREFLKQYITVKPGPIIDQNNKEIGEHDGATLYTIGQRHGLDVGGGLPNYVTSKDLDKNIVYVTSDLDDKKLWSQELRLIAVHWINNLPEKDKTYQIRMRHQAKLMDATVIADSKKATVKLSEEIRAVTPGQSCVIYEGDKIIGGGIISDTI